VTPQDFTPETLPETTVAHLCMPWVSPRHKHNFGGWRFSRQRKSL